jgi:hypothetical protein
VRAGCAGGLHGARSPGSSLVGWNGRPAAAGYQISEPGGRWENHTRAKVCAISIPASRAAQIVSPDASYALPCGLQSSDACGKRARERAASSLRMLFDQK